MKESIDLTIKPTMNCNMRCRHCFNGDDFSHSNLLSLEQACDFVEKACLEYHKVKVIFHGGEPSLVGVDFYREFYSKLKEFEKIYGTEFNNVITTNGLCLSDDFIDVLYDNNVLVNVSFDGPYNDTLRQQTSKVRDIIYKIRDKGCRLRCFCTLSKASVSHLKEIYEWFKANKISFKTLPIEKRGYAKINDEIIMSPEELVDQFEKLYIYWLTDQTCNISYSTFEEFAGLRRDVGHRRFWFGRKIALNPDGLMYSFGRSNDVNFCLGSPYDVSKLSDCFETEEYKRCISILESIRNEKCPSCCSNVVCGGVNINIAFLYVDDQRLIDYSCRQSNMLFQRILCVNDNIIKDFKAGDYSKYNKTIRGKFSEFKI